MKVFLFIGLILVGISSPALSQSSASNISSSNISRSLPKLTKTEMLLAQNEANFANSGHPDPAAGLAPTQGVCLEKNINGTLLPKVKTRSACAAYVTPTVWVEGRKVVSFSKVAPGKVAAGKLKSPKKATF